MTADRSLTPRSAKTPTQKLAEYLAYTQESGSDVALTDDDYRILAAALAASENALISKALDHAEVIGNVTAALLDLNATYDGNRVTFTFESTNNAMSYIQKARRIVEERLMAIKGLREPDHVHR